MTTKSHTYSIQYYNIITRFQIKTMIENLNIQEKEHQNNPAKFRYV